MTTVSGLPSNTQSYPSLLTTETSPSVAPNANVGQVQAAVDLSSTAGVIASFGSTGATVQTYTAAGILNSISQAGGDPSTPLPIPASGTDVQLVAQQSTDQGIVGSLASDPTASGLYTASGTMQGLSSSGSSSAWASALQANPEVASTVIADSYAQGIVGTLLAVA
jgi:hypothetical protein